MNNDEIRLLILCQYYRAKFSGKIDEIKSVNTETKDRDKMARNVNLGYLVDKGLINGKTQYLPNGATIVITRDITAWGIDAVENIIKKSLNDLKPEIRDEIKKAGSTYKMLDKLYEKCIQNVHMCEAVVKAANAIFVAVGNG